MALACLLAGACKPDFSGRASLVESARIVAVRAEPAEAPPGTEVTFTTLVASPEGTVAAPPESFAFCATPKLLTENGAVSAACANGTGVRAIGDGAGSITAATPADACALFGPDTPSADYRPRDPDITGGYYQPVRVLAALGDGADVGFGFSRLRCKLANASADVATAFAKTYVANQNPTLLPLEASLDGAPVALDAIPRGARVVLRASWPAESAEAYVSFDEAAQAIVPRRESMRVSWLATAGSFEQDRTGRDESDLATSTDDPWTAPDEPGTVHLWVVLRDARGGVAWATGDLVVR